jgi:hypothetical protein
VHPNPGSELLADNQHHPWQQNRTCIDNTFKIVEKQTETSSVQCLHTFVLTENVVQYTVSIKD